MRRDHRDLPDELALPLSTGAPWWYWLGGRPSVDLVNTLRERWNRQVETLASRDDLAAWLLEADVTADLVRIPRLVVEEALDLREAIDALIVAAVNGQSPPPSAVRTVDDLLAYAGVRPHLTSGDDGSLRLGERPPADSARRALGTIALDAAQMLGTPNERARIRICASDTCSARFYDRSPAGGRRWCSMRGCGNEAKARRHRERLRVSA